jgi:uncharacterized protein
MASYPHPGVYIEEIPGTRDIQGAPTSVAVFVGVAESGPYASPVLVTSWNAYTRQFGNLTWHGFMPWAVHAFFQEGGVQCYVVRIKQTDASQGAPAVARISNMTLSAASMGTWGNHVQVCIRSTDRDSRFQLQVVVPDAIMQQAEAPKDQATQLLIAYVQKNNLSTIPVNGSHYYVLESFGGYALADAAFQTQVNTQSIFIRVSGNDSARPTDTPMPVPLCHGRNPAWDFQDALDTLPTLDAVSLLALPDSVAITEDGGATDAIAQSHVVNRGLRACEKLQMFYVIDPPYGQDAPGIVTFKNGTALTTSAQAGQPLDSDSGALYYPWVWIAHPFADTNVPMPPSGPVLGRYVYTDTHTGVWQSPAGVTDGAMQTVTDLFSRLTDADQDVLNPNGINALRNLLNYGNVIFGARTVSPGTEWRYVSVRRLFNYVEQSIRTSLQWVAFEPSDQRLWAAVTRDINAFLVTLCQDGALFGVTTHESFFVVCDGSNNPPEVIAQGELYIDIGLAPFHPADFVMIRIVLKTAGPDAMA